MHTVIGKMKILSVKNGMCGLAAQGNLGVYLPQPLTLPIGVVIMMLNVIQVEKGYIIHVVPVQIFLPVNLTPRKRKNGK